MIMKRTFLRVLFNCVLFFPTSCTVQAQDFTIEVINVEPNETISIVNFNYPLDIFPIYETRVSKKGVGTLSSTISYKSIIAVDVGNRRVTHMLVEPNEEYKILVGKDDITFKGHNAAINNFIYSYRKVLQTFTYNGKKIEDWKVSVDFIEGNSLLSNKIHGEFDKFIFSNDISSIDSMYLAQEISYSLTSIELKYFLSTTNIESENILDLYQDVKKSIPVDDELLRSLNYKQLLNFLGIILNNSFYIEQGNLRKKYLLDRGMSIKDVKPIDGERFDEMILTDFSFLENKIVYIVSQGFPPKITEFLIARVFLMETESKLILSKYYQDYQTYLVNKEIKRLIENKIEKLADINQASVFEHLTFLDKSSKPFSINEYKGKYVYVDIWATWCGPCIKEFPSSKKLEDNFSNSKDIEFLYVSVDLEANKWQKFIGDNNNNLQGKQVRIPSEKVSTFYKNLSIVGIPKYLIIDKKGEILNTDAPRPSDPKLKDILDELLNQ